MNTKHRGRKNYVTQWIKIYKVANNNYQIPNQNRVGTAETFNPVLDLLV